jgi:uncharacterized FAD-dependent dehydrogenase
MPDKYDVIIVGSGPAGIFAALELSQASDLSILLLEKGKDLSQRYCPVIGRGGNCPPCFPCGLVSGWGGAGAFSDGKLTLSPDIGGRLKDYLGPQRTEELVHYVDDIYLKFGVSNRVYGTGADVARLGEKAELAGLRLMPMIMRHLGTEHCREVLNRMHHFLAKRLELRTGIAATSILIQDGTVKGIVTQEGQRLACRYLILAPGREGADWLVKESSKLGLTLQNNPIDVGVRVEVPKSVLEELTEVLYEPKLEFYSKASGDRVRTFCVCPAGEVTMESTGGYDPVITVNGHSYSDRETANTNFAILVSTTFPKPFRDPISYGKGLARLANIMSGGVILQRLSDLEKSRCSTPISIKRGKVEPTLKCATPGDLGFVLPYHFLTGIKEMLIAMDKLAPGVASPYTLLYGVEIKLYSSRLTLSESLETEVANMFAIGDGAGVSRGLVQASASGVIAAREILTRLG